MSPRGGEAKLRGHVLGSARRGTGGLAWAGLMVALGGCQATLQTGLPEAQANDVLIALDGRGIHATKESEPGGGEGASFAVRVAPDDVAAALAVLRQEDLPRAPDPGMHDVFGAGSLVPTATEERARLASALGGELSRSLEAVEGVLDARVHVALPDVDTLRLEGPVPRPRASVLLRHRGPASPLSPGDVRQLVAGAVQGMEPADVAVVALPVPAAPVTQAHVTGLGPFTVARRSVAGLQTLLAVLLCTNVLLAAGLAFAFARGRRGLPPPRDDANTPPGR